MKKNEALPHWLDESGRFVVFVYRKFVTDGCRQSAGALTYMSLFALVPLMTVAYNMFSLFPTFSDVGTEVQNLIFKNFLPSTGQDVQTYLVSFAEQAKNLTIFGLAFLATTAILMLKNIEAALNTIWHTSSQREGLSSFLLYWAVLSLGPLLLGAGLATSTYLASLTFFSDGLELGIMRSLLKLLPFALQTAAFTLIFAAVPNTQVNLRHALIGGATAALTFELAKLGFAAVVTNTSYALVYGAFAAVPLFLMWLYMAWIIILAGAEVVYALSAFQYRGSKNLSLFHSCIALLELLYSKHKQGQTVSEHYLLGERWLYGKYGMNRKTLQQIRDLLGSRNIIKISQNGDFILGKSLANILLRDIYAMTQDQLVGNIDPQHSAWAKQLYDVCESLRADQKEQLSMDLQSLFESKPV